MDLSEKAIQMHKDWNGKLEVVSKSPVKTREDLSIAYTPGVAEPCKIIAKDPEAAYTYTMKANTVAVISDGSAVLGLGNIGALAAMPVMEGKCVLFKEFANVNAVPIVLDTQDPDEIVKTVANLAPTFGGINLEDISAPRCFEVEERLKKMLNIPVFHDDQHGTAIVVLAGIINALRVTGKKKEDCKVVVNGAGSAGVAITKLLLTYGFKHVTMCDKLGIIGKDYPELNWMQQKMTEVTNLENQTGTLADALKGADIFVGVSAPNIVSSEMVASMNKDAILFAMANPVPEIMPDVAKAAGAKVVGTGRSDFPNQVNNVIAFPGIFKGALEGRAEQITEEMKLAAAEAIAGLVSDEELNEDFIMPEAFDPRVAEVVSQAAYKALKKRGKIPADETFKFITFGGDGGTYDIGFQSLSGAMERNHDLVYVCYDNGAYMNTGIQRSSATPMYADTTTTPVGSQSDGKMQNRKDLASIIADHDVPYVAQSTLLGTFSDLHQKAEKAIYTEGAAFLNIMTPCPRGWRYDTPEIMNICKLAVDTCYWPLFEVDHGKWILNYEPKKKLPIEDFLRAQGRFKHLFKPGNEHLIEQFQAEVDRRWEDLLYKCAR